MSAIQVNEGPRITYLGAIQLVEKPGCRAPTSSATRPAKRSGHRAHQQITTPPAERRGSRENSQGATRLAEKPGHQACFKGATQPRERYGPRAQFKGATQLTREYGHRARDKSATHLTEEIGSRATPRDTASRTSPKWVGENVTPKNKWPAQDGTRPHHRARRDEFVSQAAKGMAESRMKRLEASRIFWDILNKGHQRGHEGPRRRKEAHIRDPPMEGFMGTGPI